MFAPKGLPALSGSVRTAQVRWKGESEGACGGAPALRGFGFAPITVGGGEIALPAGATPAAAFAAGEGVAVYCAGGDVYFCSAAGVQKSGIHFARIPACARVYDGAEGLLLSDGDVCALLRGSGLTASSAPAFCSAAFYGDRLWTASRGDAGELRYSAPADAYDFAAARGKGGGIDLPSAYGQIEALLPFGDALLIFRERGVQRLRARGDERDFDVSDLFLCARIYGETVADVGGKAVWLAEDGLHAYDGGERPFCAAGAEALRGIDQSGARAAAEGGLYFLQAKLAESGEPVLAAFAADGSGASYLRCAAEGLAQSRRALFVLGGKVCAPTVGGYAAGNARRVYESEVCEPFGGRALLRAVRVRASGPFTLTARSEEGERTVQVRGVGRAERFALHLPGTSFSFRLETEAGGQVLGLSATYARGGVR